MTREHGKARVRSAVRSRRPAIPVVLTIAGSDSGGGAGIQADLKTFAALGVFGTSALTCVTAQNPSAVAGIAPVPPRTVGLQIRMVREAFPVAAAKTGMLYSAGIITAVARAIRGQRIAPLVVDPVMIATSGARLLRDDAVRALCSGILPLSSLVTPNVPEAEMLAGMKIDSVQGMQMAAEAIGRRWSTAVVVKGGHLRTDNIVNVLYDRGTMRLFEHRRAKARSTHGTGCTFSAAATAFMALGCNLPAAVEKAGEFVARAVASSIRLGRHRALNIS